MSAIAGKTCEKVGCGRRSICSLTQVRRPVLPQLFRCVWYVQRRAISRLHPAGAGFLPELLPLISELRSAAFVWRNAAPEPRHRKDSPHLGANDTHEQILFQISMAAPIGLRPACLCPRAQHLPAAARDARRRTRQPHFASRTPGNHRFAGRQCPRPFRLWRRSERLRLRRKRRRRERSHRRSRAVRP